MLAMVIAQTGFLWFGFMKIEERRACLAVAATAPAQVLDIWERPRRGRHSTLYGARMAFITATGQRVVFSHETQFSFLAIGRDEPVQVYYTAASPGAALPGGWLRL